MALSFSRLDVMLAGGMSAFIEILEAHGYVGTTLKLARHALTALYLFLDSKPSITGTLPA